MDKLQEIYDALDIILKNRFSNDIIKQKYIKHIDRVEFACPICGDSLENPNKKRGNIWFENNSYKCYNCGYFSSVKNFFIKMESDKYITELGDIIYTLNLSDKFNIISNNDRIYTNISYIITDIPKCVEKYGIVLSDFVKLLRLSPIQISPLFGYIKGRYIPKSKYNLFYYSNIFKNIIIVNIDVASQRVIGYTIRNFKGQSKYINYKLNTMYRHFKINYNEDDSMFKILDDMSAYYNITNIDINNTITYFEGPIDSMFVQNSIALNTVGAKLPIITKDIKIILDNDIPGQKKALVYLNEGKYVFMWKKYLKSIGMTTYGVDKVDFNDVIIYTKSNGKKIKDIDKYFTNNKMDLLWI